MDMTDSMQAYDRPQPIPPVVVRSRLILELVSELIGSAEVAQYGRPEASSAQAKVMLRRQGGTSWDLRLFAGDGPTTMEQVATGALDVGIVNPSALLTLACRGVQPFRGPLPLRAVAVIPSRDELALAVNPETGIESLEDIARRSYPLRLSLRGQRDHGIHVVIDHVLQVAGYSIGDIRAWGGVVSYDDGLPTQGNRLQMLQARTVDAVFDEAADTWVGEAARIGMRVLSLPVPLVERLESWGYRRSWLQRDRYPSLDSDLLTLDYSGFPVYVRDDASSVLVRQLCEAMEARRDRILLEDGRPLPLEEVWGGAEGGPLDVQLHDAARAVWEKRGYRT